MCPENNMLGCSAEKDFTDFRSAFYSNNNFVTIVFRGKSNNILSS